MPEKPTRRRFLGSAAAASVPFCLSAMGAADLDAEAGAWMLLGFGVLGAAEEAGDVGGKEMGNRCGGGGGGAAGSVREKSGADW